MVEQKGLYLRCLIDILGELGFHVDSCDEKISYEKLKNSVRRPKL
jgi:hypothetical protein